MRYFALTALTALTALSALSAATLAACLVVACSSDPSGGGTPTDPTEGGATTDGPNAADTSIDPVDGGRDAAKKDGDTDTDGAIPDDGGKILHLNLIAVSESLTLTQTPSFLDELQAIFTQVGITIVIDNVLELRGTGLSAITDSTEPQEAPASMSARLPGLVASKFTNDALDIFIVDSLPAGIGGLSLGTPGPPLRGGYYFGLLVRRSTNDSQLAIVIAHETSHFLALQHVTNVGVSGMVYPDPLDDTQPGQMNLMQSGSKLTADQGFALSRSALLRAE